MSNRGSVSSRDANQQLKVMRNRLVRTARRTVGDTASILIMLCERWGDKGSRRAAKAKEPSEHTTGAAPVASTVSSRRSPAARAMWM
jgi:hypothetical protein